MARSEGFYTLLVGVQSICCVFVHLLQIVEQAQRGLPVHAEAALTRVSVEEGTAVVLDWVLLGVAQFRFFTKAACFFRKKKNLVIPQAEVHLHGFSLTQEVTYAFGSVDQGSTKNVFA